MPRLPRLVRGQLSVVAGVLVGLVFVGYVVAGFVGAGDGADNAADSTSTAPTTWSGSPAPSPGQSRSPDGKPRSAGKSGKAGGRTRGESPALGTPSVAELSQVVRKLLQADPAAPPATFRVSSLNLLGASHTAPGGNRPGWAPGPVRMGWAVQLMRRYNVDVIGLQESEPPQLAVLNRLEGSSFDLYPGTSMGRGAVRQSIAWRTDTWKLLSAKTIMIPYFGGYRIPMPYVLLQHRQSGRGVYFFNVHNPATTKTRGNNQRWRNVASAIEAQLVRRLRATGVPVVFTGDFNERAEAFCKMTAIGLRAANGGSRANGRCSPPANAGIDWIFGSPEIEFSNYVKERGALTRRTTDHPFIVSDARITGGG